MQNNREYGEDGDPEMKAKPGSRAYFLLDIVFKYTHENQYEH